MDIVQAASIGIAVCALVLSAVALYVAIREHRTNQNAFQFQVMISCIERFQQLLPELEGSKIEDKALKRYIDLCNEELFYMRQKFVPKEVEREWLDGMISMMPQIHDTEGSNLIEQSPISPDDLRNHPRLRNAFTVSRAYDLTNPTERRWLIESIQSRIQNYAWDCA